MNKQSKPFARLLFGSGLACLALPFAASAQDSGEDKLALEEIVVTAEKIESTAQETSRAISVMDSMELTDIGAVTLQDALTNITSFGYGAAMDQPSMRGVGLDFTDTGQMAPLVAINIDGAGAFGGARGGISSGVNGALFDVERVEVVRGPSGTMVGQNALAGSVNVVTRRPQLDEWSFNGSVGFGDYSEQKYSFGANIPLGDTFAFRLAYSHSEHDCYWERTDGEVTVCGNNWQDIDQARVRMLWQPTDNFDVLLSYDYSQDSSSNGIQGNTNDKNPWLSLAGGGPPPPPGAPPATLSEPTRNPGPKDHRYSLEVTWDMNFGTLVFQPTYTVSKPYFGGLPDICDIIPDAPPCTVPEDEIRKTYEIRMNSKPGQKLEWLVGALKEEQDLNAQFTRGGSVSSDFNTVGVIDPNLALVLEDFNNANPGSVGVDFRDQRTYPPRNTESVYANLTYNISDALRLIAGFRYANDNTGGSYEFTVYGVGLPEGGIAATNWQNTNPNGDYEGVTVNGALPDVATYPGSSPNDWQCLNCALAFQELPYQYKGESNPNNYSLGVEYDWSESSMVYLNWNTGYQVGGVEAFVVPVRLYPSQRINAYALGSKNRMLDNRLELNAELYYYDYENWHGNNNNFDPLVYPFEGTDYVLPNFVAYLQGQSLNSTLPFPDNFNKGGKPYRAVLDNLGTYGLEFDMRALVSENDRISANMTLTQAEFPNYIDGFGNSLEGQRLTNSPLISARVSYEHDFHIMQGTLTPRFDMKMVSDTIVTNERTNFITKEPALDAVTQPDYFKYDFYLNYRSDSGSYSANFYVKNLANTAEVLQALPVAFIPGQITEPRTYGISFNYNYN